MSNNLMRKYLDIITESSHRHNKIEANYTDQAVGDNRCGNCSSFVEPNHCKIVLGDISPMGWCKYYKAELVEKWATSTQVSSSEKGKYAGKTKAELLKQYNHLKSTGPHKKGSPEYGRMRELAFAIWAKSGWGKVG